MRKTFLVLAALTLLFSNATFAETPATHPNILLIVVDTLRYSATSFAGADNMPFLASLGKRGVVFTNAYSTHDFTPTSHFSIFTGLRDGLGSDDDRVENGVAWQLHRLGYDTFATVANSLIGQKQMPTVRGFVRFLQPGDVNEGTFENQIGSLTDVDLQLALFHCKATPHTRAMVYFSAERLLPLFLQQIRDAHAPYFGFVNLIDTHEPYVPDPKFYPPERSLPPRFEGDVIDRRLGPELQDPDSIKDPKRRAYVKQKIADVGSKSLVSIDLSPQALQIYRARYRAEAREVDSVLHDFFAEAEREKLLDNTVVIITSDHGESFGEADLITHMFHDRGDYESTHHVPLVVVPPPGMHPKPAVIDRKVSIADIAPTIYDFAGVNWSGFRLEHSQYASSLFPVLIGTPPQYTANVAVPRREKQDQSGPERERAKALKALGYVH